MKRKEAKNLVLWGIIVILVGVLLLSGYSIFAKHKRESKEIKISYSDIAGVYVNKDAILPEDGRKYDDDGTDHYDYKRLTINEDGTAKYEDKATRRGSYEGTGQLLFGKDKIYLLNEKCHEMVVIGDSCSWPNCTNIYEFNYNDGRIYVGTDELIKK